MGLKTTILKSSIHQSNTSIESHLGGKHRTNTQVNYINCHEKYWNSFSISFIAILDIEDEADYWCVVKKHTSNKEESIAAEKICSLFLPVSKQLK